MRKLAVDEDVFAEQALVSDQVGKALPENVVGFRFGDEPHLLKAARLQEEEHVFRSPDGGKAAQTLERFPGAKHVAGGQERLCPEGARVHVLVELEEILGRGDGL